ncbi:MAG: site-specific integrase [Burkholderiaceae bacterium]|nr:site-specific integrase [Burkholderiaceae bacterium]
MSIVVRPRGAKFELRVKHSLLPKIFTATFEFEADARNYGEQLEALLSRGVVPAELAAKRDRGTTMTLGRLIADYQSAVSVSTLDVSILDMLMGINELGVVRVDDATRYKWAEDWVKSMKLVKNLAPGTIRKRVGAVARLLDWHLKRQAADGQQPLANPLRLLPKNYSAYNDHERTILDGHEEKRAKVDQSRDRRLREGEDEAIRAALRGEKRDDRQRPLALPEGDAMLDLYSLIVNTGLRLREAYSLRPADVRLPLRTIHIGASKTGAARDVPILPAIYDMLERRLAAASPNTPIFPWWDGDKEQLKRVTAKLSAAFATAFKYAGCEGLTEHDLRHEATCRWVTMRTPDGGWMFRSEECMKITGHENFTMFMRYLSLRGSDLADRLWT